MASIISNFTSADRRKKAVTYGKKSRPSIIPTPPPDPTDAGASPERSRKVVATTKDLSKTRGKLLKPERPLGAAPGSSNDHDIFQVPSDDEITTHPIKHAKRLSKHRLAVGNPVTSRLEMASTTSTRRNKPVQTLQPLSKSRISKVAAPDAKIPRKADQLSAPDTVQEFIHQSQRTIAPRERRRACPQPKQDATKEAATKQLGPTRRVTSRATTPALSAPSATTPALSAPSASAKLKGASIVTSKNATSKQPKKASDSLDIFDMPPSDEDEVLPQRKPSRAVCTLQAKEDEERPKKAKDKISKSTAESDDSNASRKRKRRGSVSSITTRAAVDDQLDAPPLQRGRKFPRKDTSMLSSSQVLQHSKLTVPQREASSLTPTINKPKRTRQRTVPVFPQRTINKGKSSPAQLSSMLSKSHVTKPSPVREETEFPTAEDETMYEIPDSPATPARPSVIASPSSVTPRQKALFNSLLGDTTSSTTMPSIEALRLSEKKPNTSLGSLSRSKLDLACSAQARKTRLIDTLKRADTSSEDEEDDDDDDMSDNGSNAPSEETPRTKLEGQRTLAGRSESLRETQSSAAVDSEDMDVDPQLAFESQTSQATSTFSSRAKFTYAKTRSYLEEANPEDALLISMGMEDDLGFDPQSKDGLSGDEDDPMSQVQAHHVLKRKGQQNRFNDDVRMHVDDLPVACGNTVRRGAILELCSKMRDETFVDQLLDSTLATKFFANITSNGEVIFDFATAVAIVFILDTSPTSLVLDQIYRTGIIASLVRLTGNDLDVRSIAKSRKTNLSRIAVESVTELRTGLLASAAWTRQRLDKVTPRFVALRALESLVVGLRQSGNSDLLLDQGMVSAIIDVASMIPTSGTVCAEDLIVLQMITSILESVSVTRQKQLLWPAKILERLAEVMAVVFGLEDSLSTIHAVKLCMNLTNNIAKACLPFSGRTFVQPLAAAVIRNFARLRTEAKQEERAAVLESLILSLGALINLAEFSDQARLSFDDGEQMISTLVQIFKEGSERASQAQSLEESQSNVPVGYLTVLLGNICLNRSINTKVRAELPEQRLEILINKIKEFVQYHEHVDSKTKEYEGSEGRETWQNYTTRLMLVVEKLEGM